MLLAPFRYIHALLGPKTWRGKIASIAAIIILVVGAIAMLVGAIMPGEYTAIIAAIGFSATLFRLNEVHIAVNGNLEQQIKRAEELELLLARATGSPDIGRREVDPAIVEKTST